MTRSAKFLIALSMALGGLAVAFSSIALSRSYKPAAGAEVPNITDWMQGWGNIAGVVAGSLAAIAAAAVYLQGRTALRTAEAQRSEDLALAQRGRLDEALRIASRKYLDAIQKYATFITSLNVGEVLITGEPVRSSKEPFSVYSDHSHAISNAVAELMVVAPENIIEMATRHNSYMHDFNIKAQRTPMTAKLKYSHADDIYNLARPFLNSVRAHFSLGPMPLRQVNLAAHAEAEDSLREVDSAGQADPKDAPGIERRGCGA